MTIGNGVTSIGNYAFYKCSSLTGVTIPDSVTSIGDSAFELCDSLTSLTIGNGVTSIGPSAFKGCNSLTSVAIPDSVTSIGDYAFLAVNLQSITVPASVMSIGTAAFGYMRYSDQTKEKINRFIVYGYDLTEAQFWAADNGFVFVSLGPAPPVLTHVAGVAPTCTEPGTIEYWTDGARFYTDREGVNEITLAETVAPATGHTPDDPVKENEKPATCTEAGSYESVVYCTVCHEEISRETVTVDALGHDWGQWTTVTEPTEEAEGLQERECARCHEQEQEVLPKLVPGEQGSLDHFVKIQTYEEQFEDVAQGTWYHDDVATAYELGLVKGASPTNYNRKGDIKIGETIALACRIRSIYMADNADFTAAEGEKWYDPYVHYAIVNGIIRAGEYEVYNVPATREQFAAILAKALPVYELNSINNVAAIPDLPMDPGNEHVQLIYLLYNAGVLTGNDSLGTFTPNAPIKRSEVAAIIVRMAVPAERKSLNLG